MNELTEDNNFGLNLPEKNPVANQGNTLFLTKKNYVFA